MIKQSNTNHSGENGGTVRPRVCLPTWRNMIRTVARCAPYEAQDVFSQIDDVEYVNFHPGPFEAFRTRVQKNLMDKRIWKGAALWNPGLQTVKLSRDFDLMVAMCQSVWDIPFVNAVKNWKDKCRVSVCWIDEVWAGLVPKLDYLLHALQQFDHVIVGVRGSVDALSKLIGRPVHFVPPAVDAMRFSPYPNPSPRSIDVFSMGRKLEGMHEAFLGMVDGKEIFYLHDTARDAGDIILKDYRQHRNLLANIAKRSRCFVVAPAKMDTPEETLGQSDVGYRYFEGAMAGALMLGQRPQSQSFQDLFDWPDVVVDVDPSGSDVVETIRSLNSEPERVREICRRNAQEALLRHDWVYRWGQILAIAGLESTPAMKARERKLKEMAKLAETPGE